MYWTCLDGKSAGMFFLFAAEVDGSENWDGIVE